MKQLNLELKNYRKFKVLHLNFHPRFTLLTGINGSGKSSVLHGIWHSWQPMITDITGGIGALPTLKDVHRSDSVEVSPVSWQTAPLPQLPQFPLHAVGSFSLGHVEEGCVGITLRRTESSCHPDVIPWNQVGASVQAAFQSNASTSIPLIARFGIAAPCSEWVDDLSPPFAELKDVWARAQSDEVQLADLTRWFKYYELRGLRENETPLLLKLVRKAVMAAIHAEDIGFIIRENALMVRHADVGWRKFSDLSDGQQRIAAIFCDLAMRCASLNSHLGEKAIEETTGVVTIDELDLHLHPQWQRTVIQDLLSVFPNLQFIATSHSPFLLQAAFAQGTVIDLGTGQAVTALDESIEDIAEHVMGVHPFPQRSQRWHDMKAVAAEYYRLLEVAKQSADSDEVKAVKSRLDALIIPYADDPAYAAWLEMHRAAAGV